MDGNGRWATRRGLPRAAGHRAGVAAVRRMVRAAPDLGITALTLYAFSSDNWSRPPAEVTALMRLFARYLHREVAELVAQSVRLSIIGRRDRLPAALVNAIVDADQATSGGTRLDLRIAVDYSARAAIRSGTLLPDVDLLIRTGGEQRLSDFLLW
ncbi:MAG: di-trans,poly-cis-decaprenylcistransferase, partial [Chloroflexi bacterium]